MDPIGTMASWQPRPAVVQAVDAANVNPTVASPGPFTYNIKPPATGLLCGRKGALGRQHDGFRPIPGHLNQTSILGYHFVNFCILGCAGST